MCPKNFRYHGGVQESHIIAVLCLSLQNKSGSTDGDGVIAYATHSSPVNCMQFHTKFHHQMYSCSYDGMLRCVNFTTGIADEVSNK